MAITAPEGTKDLLPDEAAFWAHFKATAANVCGRYGYAPIETPLFEQTELFVRGIGEATDVVSKEMFTAISGQNLATLLDGGTVKAKSRLSLRPEGTAGVVRAVVQHDLVPQGAAPAKLMYAGPMFRAERPQKGRQRQFNQVGIECLGAEDPSVDAEGIIMLMRFFAAIGIPAEATRLLVNSMGCEQCRPAYRDAVKAYMDAHADELCDECKRRAEINPLRAFDCKNDRCREVMATAPLAKDNLCDGCAIHYAKVKQYLDEAGVTYVEDPTLVRGLDYYTRTVFEVECEGSGVGAIGGGGRYDGLMELEGGKPTPGIGFAVGFERMCLALRSLGVDVEGEDPGCVYVACTSAAERDAVFSATLALRGAGVRTEADYQGRSLKSQFKQADKLGARLCVVLGSDEIAAGVVTLRDMRTHEQGRVPMGELAARVVEKLG